jgi:hypothetical protein
MFRKSFGRAKFTHVDDLYLQGVDSSVGDEERPPKKRR